MKSSFILSLALFSGLSLAKAATPASAYPAIYRTQSCQLVDHGLVTASKKPVTLTVTMGVERALWSQDGTDFELRWFLENYDKTFAPDLGVMAWKSAQGAKDNQGRSTESFYQIHSWLATAKGLAVTHDDTRDVQKKYSESGVETDQMTFNGQPGYETTIATQELSPGQRKVITTIADYRGQNPNGPYDIQSSVKTCTEKDLTRAQIAKSFKGPMLSGIKKFEAALAKVDQAQKTLTNCQNQSGANCSADQAAVDAAVKSRDAQWKTLLTARQLLPYVMPRPTPGGHSGGGSGGGVEVTTCSSSGICSGPGGITTCSSSGICSGPGGITTCSSSGVCSGPSGITTCSSSGVCSGPAGITTCSSSGICSGPFEGAVAACGSGICCR